MLFALPFLVGFAIAKMSVKTIVVVAAIVILFVIAVVILGSAVRLLIRSTASSPQLSDELGEHVLGVGVEPAT